jgi:hypothetical protein
MGQGTKYSSRGTKNIIYMRNRYVGGKEQIIEMMEQKIIYTRNGDVGGNQQIIAVM